MANGKGHRFYGCRGFEADQVDEQNPLVHTLAEVRRAKQSLPSAVAKWKVPGHQTAMNATEQGGSAT
jgi:hypothetical protein